MNEKADAPRSAIAGCKMSNPTAAVVIVDDNAMSCQNMALAPRYLGQSWDEIDSGGATISLGMIFERVLLVGHKIEAKCIEVQIAPASERRVRWSMRL